MRGCGFCKIEFKALFMVLASLSGCDKSLMTGPCNQSNECPAGSECRLGMCRLVPLQTDAGSPTRDSGVDAGRLCPAGDCELGARCASKDDCTSGSCADGVCCNEACNAGCGVCASVGFLGICKPKAAGSECGAFACDGKEPACPTTCKTENDCAYSYACCVSGGEGYSACNAQGKARQCVKLPACSSVKDDFNGPAFDSVKWSVGLDEGASLNQTDGRLLIKLGVKPNALTSYSSIVTREHCSLVGSSYTAQFEAPSALAGTAEDSVPQMAVGNDRAASLGSYTLFSKPQGLQSLQDLADGGAVYSPPVAINAGSPRFLRIRENARVVFFEYSLDGVKFEPLSQRPVELRASDVVLRLGVFQFKPQPDAGASYSFDNVNVGP